MINEKRTSSVSGERPPADSFTAASARPECGVLLACARAVLPSGERERLRALLEQPLDWDWLLAMSERHGLLPLLFTHLKAEAADLVPASQLETLRQRFQDNLSSSMRLTGVLHKVLSLFQSHGVEAIPYKGPVLAQQFYLNLALRSFSDLDLLIRHRDVPAAARILLDAGFHPESGAAVPAADGSLGAAGQFAFVGENGALVELHSERTLRHFPRPLDIEWLFAHPTTVSLAGRDVRTLACDRLLLALAVHGAKDFWSQLKWICDIAELLRTASGLDSHLPNLSPLPWTALWNDAHRFGCERVLLLALRLAQDVLGTSIPAGAQSAGIDDPAVASLSAQVAARLFEAGVPRTFGAAPERFLFRVRMCSRTWDGLRYALRLTMTPAEEDRALRLPPALAPIYSLLRPFRLLAKYGIARGRSSRSI